VKNKRIGILIAAVILGFSLVGCTSIKDRIINSINPFSQNKQENEETEGSGGILNGLAKMANGMDGADTSEFSDELSQVTNAVNSLSNAGDREVTGDYTELGKYKVEEILTEDDLTDFGLYGITYHSSADVKEAVNYFDDLLIGTPDYVCVQSESEHAANIYGTINGNWVSVLIEQDDSKITEITFTYCYEVEE